MPGAERNHSKPKAGSESVFHAAAAGLICLYFILILPGLGATTFWNDESYTAVMGRNVIEKGFPSVIYEGNLIANDTYDYNKFMLEAAHGWVSYYLCAAGFLVAGDSEFGGRIPFVMIGALVLLALIAAGRLLYGRFAGIFAGLLLVLHPSFLQHARQCRYYMPALLLFVIGLILLHRFMQRRSRGVGLALCLFFLFQSQQLFGLLFVASTLVIFAIGASWRIDPKKRGELVAYLKSWVPYLCLVTLLVGGSFAFFSWGRQVHHGAFFLNNPSAWITLTAKYLSGSFKLFPVMLLLGLMPFARKEVSALPGALALLSIGVLALVPREVLVGGVQTERYYLFMMPLGALIAARGVLMLRNLRALAVCAALLMAGMFLGNPNPANLLGRAVADAKSHAAGLQGQMAFYHHPPKPDPERQAINTILEAWQPVTLCVSADWDGDKLLYYAQSKKRLRNFRHLKERPVEPYIVFRSPMLDPDNTVLNRHIDLTRDCERRRFENMGFLRLNHAENPPLPNSPYDWTELSLEIFECNTAGGDPEMNDSVTP